MTEITIFVQDVSSIGGKQVTDRLNGVVVTFEKPIRDDDAQSIIDAIRQLRGVIDVSPVVGDVVHDDLARIQADHKWRMMLYELLNKGPEGLNANEA